MNKLILIQNEKELREVIDTHLTLTLHADFDHWLLNQINEVQKTDSALADRVNRLRYFISSQQENGDYLKAQFDEAHPANLAEVLLALARRVERGELELSVAVEQGVRLILENPHYALPSDQYALARSIAYAQNQAAYVILAELMYQIGKQLPDLENGEYPMYLVLLNTRLAEAPELLERHDYNKVFQAFDRILTVAERSGNGIALAIALLNLGNFFKNSLELQSFPDHLFRAEQYYLRACKICVQEFPASLLYADVLMGLGTVLIRQEKRIEEGIGRLKECLAIRRLLIAIELQPVLDCLMELIGAYMQTENFEAVSIAVRDALTLFRDIEEITPTHIPHLENLAAAVGQIVGLIGENAAEAVKEATLLAKKLATQTLAQRFRSSVYNMRGSYLRQKGDIQGALDAFTVAIEEARACGDEKYVARWLANRGQTYLWLGQLEKSNADFNEAAETQVRLEDYMAAANFMMSHGHQLLLLSRDSWIQAANAFADAFTFFHKAGLPHMMGSAVLNLGKLYRERGHLQRAEACINYAVSKFKAANALRDICYAKCELAALQARQGNAEEAVKTYTEAIALAQQIGEVVSEPDFRIARGLLLEVILSEPEKAEEDYRQAIELYENTRGLFRAAGRRMQVQLRSEEAYTLLIRLLSRHSEQTEARSKAFAYAERARSRTLGELLSRRPVRQPACLTQEMSLREERLLKQLTLLEASEDVGLEVAQKYAQLNQELNKVWDEIAKKDQSCSEYVALRRTPVADVAEIVGFLKE